MYTDEEIREAINRDFHKVRTRGIQNKVDCWRLDAENWEVANNGEFIEVYMPNGTVMRKKVHTRVIQAGDMLYKKAFIYFRVNGLAMKRNLPGMYVRKPVVPAGEVVA